MTINVLTIVMVNAIFCLFCVTGAIYLFNQRHSCEVVGKIRKL